jgi:hypothetical protein
MPLKDVVSYLGTRRASGALHLERGPIIKHAWLQDGMVVTASSNQPREFLGQFLINMGHLTEDQFLKAYQTQKETRIFLGKILVMIGLVTEEVVSSALALKLRETVLEGFTWEDGSFVFDPAEPIPAIDGLEVKVDLLDIQREGEFRETAWQAIRSVFPHGRIRLALNEAKLAEPPRPGSLDGQLMALIRERYRIDDMVLTLHANDFFVYQRLYALYRQEVVRVDDSAGPDEGPAGRGLSGKAKKPEETAAHAEQLLEEGHARDAELLARQAYETSLSPEHLDLLHRCEKALAEQLRASLLAGNRVPSLLVAPARLKSMTLSAPEKYLLSKVDGRRDLGSIISVSPLQELEALKLFQHFLDSGLMTF